MKQIKTSAQKKFLFVPAFNVFIIWIFSCINLSYLKSKGKDFGFLNIKFVFSAFIYLFWIPAIFTLGMFLLNHINIPYLQLFILIGMYINSTMIDCRLIKFQNKLGIEE